MNVLIVARTKMHQDFRCIGGLMEIRNGQYRSVRLMDGRGGAEGDNWQADAPFQIGQIWDLEVTLPKLVEPPHVEDIGVRAFRLVQEAPEDTYWLIQSLKANAPKITPLSVWKGSPNDLFKDGKQKVVLNATRAHGGSGYMTADHLAQVSVGFWYPDYPLLLDYQKGEPYYIYDKIYKHAGVTKLKYIGEAPPIEKIPAHTLVRVSLSRWTKIGDFPDACWLMMSGWFLT